MPLHLSQSILLLDGLSAIRKSGSGLAGKSPWGKLNASDTVSAELKGR